MDGSLIRLVVMALGFFVSSSLASESNLTLALQKKAEADQLKKDKDFSNAGEGYLIGMVDYMSMKIPGVDTFATHVEKTGPITKMSGRRPKK